MKMKTIATTAFALILSTSFTLAQAGETKGGVSTGLTNSFADNEKSTRNSEVRNIENFEIRDRQSGDFAETGGLPNRSRAWNPTGQVDPGTSNSPGPNSGGDWCSEQTGSETPGARLALQSLRVQARRLNT
jgi:hypothetical protein